MWSLLQCKFVDLILNWKQCWLFLCFPFLFFISFYIFPFCFYPIKRTRGCAHEEKNHMRALRKFKVETIFRSWHTQCHYHFCTKAQICYFLLLPVCGVCARDTYIPFVVCGISMVASNMDPLSILFLFWFVSVPINTISWQSFGSMVLFNVHTIHGIYVLE